MTNTDNNYLTEEDIGWDLWQNGELHLTIDIPNGHTDEWLKKQILSNQESIKSIREYLNIMENEPEGYILISEVYHSIRRMLNDE